MVGSETVQIAGLDRVLDQLANIASAMPTLAQDALTVEAELIMTEAKRRTPVLTGALRSSGVVLPLDGEIGATLTFGGPAAPYAVYVHENMEAFHGVGQAKFLESAVLEAIPSLPQQIADRIRGWLGA